MNKTNIKDMDYNGLKAAICGLDCPAYRADQIFDWLYKKKAVCFKDMSNLLEKEISLLDEAYEIISLSLVRKFKSKDSTEKYVFLTKDKHLIETVVIYHGERVTICISTQIGCRFNCKFCASGTLKFVRNLSTAEIIDQIVLTSAKNISFTNYVFMGIGEPLDNFENLRKSIEIIVSKKAMDSSPKRITISTCGFIPGIKKLINSDIKANLSLSLHAVNDKLRSELMPVNKSYPIGELIKTLKEYAHKKKQKITVEYILIDKKNDSSKDASELAKIAKSLKAKINIINLSKIESFPYSAPSEKNIKSFTNIILKKGINVTIRKSKGQDIKAACGQLAGQLTKM